MAKKSVIRNYIYNMSYEILALLIPIITTPYLSRVLGASGTGIIGAVGANVSYFTLFASLGTSDYAYREIARCQDSRDDRTNVFFNVMIVRAVMTVVSLAVFFLAFLPFQSGKTIYYIIGSLNIVSVSLNIGWFFQGLEEFRTIAIRDMIIRVCTTVCLFVFVKNYGDTWLYMLIYGVSSIVSALCIWPITKKYLGHFTFSREKLWEVVKGSLKLLVPCIAVKIYTVLDRTMLEAIVDESEVAYYSQPETVIKMVVTVITALGTVLLPRVSNLIKKEKYEEAQFYFTKSVAFALLFCVPATIGGMFIAEDFILFFLGDDFAASVPVFAILCMLFLILGTARIVGSPFMLPLGRESRYTVCVSVGAVVNFSLNMVFIRLNGAIGAAIATIIAETCVTALELYFIRDKFRITGLRKNIVHYFIAAVAMALSLIPFRWLEAPHAVGLFVRIAVGVTVYFAVLLLLKDSFLFEFIGVVRSKIGNRLKKSTDSDR